MQLAHYKKFFVAEANRKVKEFEDRLVSLERAPRDTVALAAIVIALHALKGDAATMSYRKLANGMQVAEGFFSAARDGSARLTREDIDRSFLLVDAVRRSIASIEEHDVEIDLSSALEFMLAQRKPPASGRAGNEVKNASRQRSEEAYEPLGSYVATPTESLDNTMSLVNELIAHQQQLARAFRNNNRGAATIGLHRIGTTLSELRAHVLEIKMIPVRQYFVFLSRLVRDVAREERSFVRFVLEDNEVRLERHVLDALRDPCLQLVKNAVAHGFPKGARGTVTLSFSLKADTLHIIVVDTGSGINWEGLALQAVKQGVVSRHALRALSKRSRELALLTAGVSTRGSVTIASGRGVGLQTVYAGVRKLGGSVVFVSRRRGKAQGTVVTITIPLPPTMYRALVFQWGPYRCALPLFALESVVQLEDGTKQLAAKSFSYKGQRISLYRPETLLLGPDLLGSQAAHGSAAILRGRGGRLIALLLPRTLHEEELVTTQLPCLAKNALIAGVAISEESVPVTVINVDYIVEAGHAKR